MYMDTSEESSRYIMDEYEEVYDDHSYYDNELMDDLYENPELYDTGHYDGSVTFADLTDKCLVPVLSQTVTSMVPLMIICFMSHLVQLLVSDGNYLSLTHALFTY